LGDLAGRVQRRRFGSGQVLIRQGDPATAFWLLRRGRCTVTQVNDVGQESVIAYLHPGQAFGDLALREATVEPVTVRADTDGEAFLVDAGTFRRLLAARLAPSQIPVDWPTTRVRSLRPFRDLPPTAVAEMAASGTWIRLPPDHQVGPWDAGGGVFVVASGQLEARADGRPPRILRTGDVFCDPAGGNGIGPASALAVWTLTPVQVFTIPRGVVDAHLSPLPPGAASAYVSPAGESS
jgi:hypothetical protein